MFQPDTDLQRQLTAIGQEIREATADVERGDAAQEKPATVNPIATGMVDGKFQEVYTGYIGFGKTYRHTQDIHPGEDLTASIDDEPSPYNKVAVVNAIQGTLIEVSKLPDERGIGGYIDGLVRVLVDDPRVGHAGEKLIVTYMHLDSETLGHLDDLWWES